LEWGWKISSMVPDTGIILDISPVQLASCKNWY
jgi:hypothetical protein